MFRILSYIDPIFETAPVVSYRPNTAAMASTDKLVFYKREWSPMSQAIELALKAAKLPYETVKLNPTDSAVKTLPELSCRGTAIVNYSQTVAALCNLGGQHISSCDVSTRDKQLKVLEHFVDHIIPFFDRSVIFADPKQGFGMFVEAMSFLENQLTSNAGRFFGGDQPCFIDYGIFPYLEKIGTWTQSLQPSQLRYVQAWMKAMREIPLISEVFTREHSNEARQVYAELAKTVLAA